MKAATLNNSSSDCPQELLCNEDDVLELLLSLDVTKANRPDDISATMLKATAPTIAKGVMILFQVFRTWCGSEIVEDIFSCADTQGH